MPMDAKPFTMEETHGILELYGADIATSSAHLGWTASFASVQREQPFDGPLKANPNCLLVLPYRGPADMTYRIERRELSRQVQQGAVFVLPPMHECHLKLHLLLDTIHVYLRPSLFHEDERLGREISAGLAPILGEPDNVIEHLVNAMGEIVLDRGASATLLADSIAQAVANRLISLNYKELPRAVAPDSRAGQLSARRLRDIRNYVESNLARDIRLDELAALCELSNGHFLRMFKASVGTSPYQYVLNCRIGRAKMLLRDPKITLGEVALQCGFSHQQHLTSTFRRFTGVTPGVYRRNR